ncbi:MAG: NAD(P)-dependent oxidoreductase [Acidimicrobiales bacterium]
MTNLTAAAPGSTRLGWIGTGVMGTSMCGHLLARGYAVTVSTRTRSKADPLVEAGATWAETPGDVAAASDVVFTMVGYPADVRQVVLGPGGVLASASPGAVIVDMSTSEPALAVEIAEAATARAVHCLDAPVSGGDVGARNATLSIMVGGAPDVFDALKPCFEVMGATVVLQGQHGAGQHAKMMNQVLIASNMVGVCEALLYAYRAGLDLDTVLASVSGGAAGSWSLSNLAPRMIANNMAPGFYVDHFVKDMGIALSEASRMRLSLPGLALAHQLYVALQAQGGGANGTQALVRALATLSGVEWEQR